MIKDQSKEYTVEQPDIKFNIETNRLYVFLRYGNEINGKMIFQFFKDKILIQLSDSSNTEFREYPQQYIEMSINFDQRLDYNPGIDDDIGVKILGIDIEGILDKINAQLEKDSITTIKINSIKREAEFDLPSGMKIYPIIFDVSEREINVLNVIHANIEKMRSDIQIESASAKLELLSLEKISKFNGKTNGRDVKNRILLTLDTKGLHATNFDKKTIFEIPPKKDNNSDSTILDFQTKEDVEESRRLIEDYIRECNSQELLTEFLSDLKVNNPQSVLVGIDYIKNFVLLNDIDHRKILIEIRQDKTLILQKVGSEEIRRNFLNDVLLVIAPCKQEILHCDKGY